MTKDTRPWRERFDEEIGNIPLYEVQKNWGGVLKDIEKFIAQVEKESQNKECKNIKELVKEKYINFIEKI